MTGRGNFPELGGQGGIVAGFGPGADFEGVGGAWAGPVALPAALGQNGLDGVGVGAVVQVDIAALVAQLLGLIPG